MTTSNMAQVYHEYKPTSATDPHCSGGWYNDSGDYIKCNTTQEDSVLHTGYGKGCYRGCCASDADHRQRHDHGGGDCMCFEMVD